MNGNINIAGSDGAIIFGALARARTVLRFCPVARLSLRCYRTGPNSWLDASGNKIADSDDLLTTFGNVTWLITSPPGGADGGIVLGQVLIKPLASRRICRNLSNTTCYRPFLVRQPQRMATHIRGGGNDSSCQICLIRPRTGDHRRCLSGIVTLSDEIKGGSGSAADPVHVC